MRKIFMLALAGIIFTSCNNNSNSSKETKKDSTVSAAKIDYPYTIEQPDNWETGSPQNTLIVLKALKAWENKNVDELMSYFGDSVHVLFDRLDKKITRDSLKNIFEKDTPLDKSRSVKVSDWESVISKDKKDEYVTVWYRQYLEDQKGKKDSLAVINDAKLQNGKIVEIGEYRRLLH